MHIDTERKTPDSPVATQRTLREPATVRGVGYVTGAETTVRLLPTGSNRGIRFIRVDMPERPEIQAVAGNALDRRRRTALGNGTVVIEMVEHVLSALSGLGIDNCDVEISAGELPGLDGSAKAFMDAIDAAGVVTLDAPRKSFVVREPVSVSEGDSMIALHPGPTDRLTVTYNLDYPHAGVGKQSRTSEITPDVYRRDIGPARTFILEDEIAALRAQGLGTKTSLRDLLVFDASGLPIDNELRFGDECVRHKILDVVGDLSLFGRPIYGHVFAHKSGHQLNVALVRKLHEQIAIEQERKQLIDAPVMDSVRIEKALKHRFPFLLVDRVVELDPNRRAVAIKNVTYNEPFFPGHWPGRPVMPGVLIVEAMAQTAGLMLTDWQATGRLAFISSMDEIKFRRPVTPGDQLRLVSEAVRVKSRTAVLKVSATVNRELAAEARMNFVLAGENADL